MLTIERVTKALEWNRRRAVKAGNYAEKIPAEWLFEKYFKQLRRCAFCNEILTKDWVVEHRISITWGGEHSRDNISLACTACNVRKRSCDYFYYLDDMYGVELSGPMFLRKLSNVDPD